MKQVKTKVSGKRFTRMKRNYQLYLFVLPMLVYLIIFKYIPMYGVQIAFKDRLLKKGFTDIEIPERHYEIGLT